MHVSRFFLVCSLVALPALAFASPGGDKKAAALDAQSHAATQSYVDGQMANTLESIDRSLDVLDGISKTGVPAPGLGLRRPANKNTNPDPITATTAVHPRVYPTPTPRPSTPDAEARLDITTVNAPLLTPPRSAQEIKLAADQAEALGAALDRRLDVTWSGSASGLLAEVARQIGYSYAEGDSRTGPAAVAGRRKVVIRSSGLSLTVRQLLDRVSSQLGGTADIFVSVPAHTLALVVGADSEQVSPSVTP